MTLLKTLENLGIQEKQAKVYLACLELGSATIQELAQKSKVKRTSIYNFLEELKNLGLITEIKEGKKLLLIPENPETVIKRAQQRIDEVKKSLPEILGIFNRPTKKPKVRFYQGLDGLQQVYSDYAVLNQPIYAFSDFEKMFEALPADFLWLAAETRGKSNSRFYCIAKDGKMGRVVQSKDKEHLRETRLVPNIDFETEINIYSNKVSLISFRKPYAAVIIEDEAIAKTLKSIWNLVWDRLQIYK